MTRAPLLFFAVLLLAGCNSYPTVALDPEGPTPTPTPSAPVGVLDSAGNGRVLVQWSPNPAAESVTSYSVYRAASPWATWNTSLPQALLTTGLTCCAFDATSLQNDLTYSFAVTAVNGGGESLQSTQISSLPPGWGGSLQFGTTGSDNGNSVAVAPDGSIYVVGTTDGALHGQTNQGVVDFFITKFDPSGEREWTRQFGSSGSDRAHGAATDLDGNVYVVGETSGALEVTSLGGLDIFVSKHLAFDGSAEWIRQLGTPDADQGHAVSIDESGDVLIAGTTTGALSGANQGAGDLVVAKFDNTGTLDWVRQRGTTGNDIAFGIDVDGAGDAYAGGFTEGGLDGNVNAGFADLVLVKYSSAGVFQWTRQRGTPASEYAAGVSVDGNANIYVVGYTLGALDGNVSQSPGVYDAFAMRFDVDGNKQWTSQIGTADADTAVCISTDLVGRIFIAGQTHGDFDGTGAKGGGDAFVAALDPSNGLPIWKRQAGTSELDFALGVGSGTALYIAGETIGDFAMPNAGVYDVFLVKYSLSGVVQ